MTLCLQRKHSKYVTNDGGLAAALGLPEDTDASGLQKMDFG